MTFALRPTGAATAEVLVGNLLSDQNDLAQLQQQISSGQRINRPSDDPAGTTDLMATSAALDRARQCANNAADGLGWLGVATSTLNNVLGTLNQVRSIVLESGDPARPQESLNALADQVDALRASVLEAGNTTYLGRAIFAGTAQVSAAFDAAGSYLGTTSPPGTNTSPTRVVDPSMPPVPVSVTGDAVFGTGPGGLLSSTPGALGVLAQISADLRSGNVTALTGADLGNLDTNVARIVDQAGVAGAYYRQIQSAQNHAQSLVQELQTHQATVQNVDMAQAITDLNLRQSAYQAALLATSKVGQLSLAEYL